MKVSIFTSLIECSKKAHIKSLGLSENDRLNELKRSAKEVLISGLIFAKDKKTVMAEITEIIRTGLDESCVEYPSIIKMTQDKYISYFADMLDYAYGKTENCKALIPRKGYSVDVGKTYHGTQVDYVEGSYDFIILREDEAVAVSIITSKKNPYKVKGRKVTTTNQYSPSLMFKWKAVSDLYPELTVHVEDWYLIPENKETGNFDKKGNRVCNYEYTNESYKIALNAVLNANECHSCDSCRYLSLCNVPNVRYEECTEAEDKGSSDVTPNFTEEQKAAIGKKQGVYEIVAVAGSGKTMVLTYRTANLIKSGVIGKRIAMITFTKKAAAEMKTRLRTLLPDAEDYDLPMTATFHSFAFDIITKYPVYFGGVLRLAADGDKRKIIKELLKTYPEIRDMNYEVTGKNSICVQMFTYLKQITDFGAEVFRKKHSKFAEEKTDAIISFCALVNKTLSERGYITYDEMCPLLSRALKKYKSLREEVCSKYDFVMVDEFQDTSSDQYEMVKTLVKHGCENLMVVGDDDQSIYGFRGGSSRFFRELEKDFPNCEKIYLGNNFRCSNAICDCASRFVEKNDGRIPKDIRGIKDGQKPFYKRDASLDDLYIYVKRLMEKRCPGDIAVQAHNNVDLFEVYEYLKARGIKCSRPKDYMREDSVFILLYDLMNYFGSDNDYSLYRSLRFLGVSDNDFPEKADRSVSYSMNLYQYTDENTPIRLALNRIESAVEQFDECDEKPGKAISAVAKIMGLPERHKVYNALMDLAEEKNVVSLFGENSLFEIMSDIVEFEDDARVGYEEDRGEVQLLTSHDGKGKQFDSVIIWKTERFGFDEEGERNLMYVAATRAKNTLIFLEGPQTECDGAYKGYAACKDYVQLLA